MTILEHLDALLTVLNTWAADFGAAVKTAAGPQDVLKAIEADPTGLKLFLAFTGEQMPEEQSQALVVWRTFIIIIVRPHGWTLERAENLTTGDSIQSPLLWLLEGARNAVISAQTGEHQELWPRYTATTKLDEGDLPMDLWQLEFTAGAQLAPLNA